MKSDLVVGLGEVLFDVLPDGRKLGGAPANYAYHVSQFGFDACLVSAIGEDEAGREVIDTFQRIGLNSQLAKVDYPTGTAVATLDREGAATYDIKEGAAWDNIPWSQELEQLAHRTQAVAFGSLAQRSATSRATINRFLDSMPEREGTLKIFDINIRKNFYTRDIIESSLRKCNVLKLNDEELVLLGRLFGYPGFDLEAKCRRIMGDYDVPMLILTCGVNGSHVFSPDTTSNLPTPRVQVIDTIGAGDSFSAAFSASILLGKSLKQAHRKATEVSAYVCTQRGAMPKLPRAILETWD